MLLAINTFLSTNMNTKNYENVPPHTSQTYWLENR